MTIIDSIMVEIFGLLQLYKYESAMCKVVMICLKIVTLIMILIQPQVNASSIKTTDGVTLNYQVIGVGTPLVMLHSGMMSRDDMAKQITYFSKYYQVIAIDSREQGRSSESAEQISYDLMSKDVIELLNKLKIKKANIFGQSDGAITALLTTQYHPERVLKLIIHGAVYNYNAYGEEFTKHWNNYQWDGNKAEDIDPKRFPGMAIQSYLLGRSDLSEFGKHLQEMALMWSTSPNLTTEDLTKIEVPTLIIVGDHYDVSLSHSVKMHEFLPNSELFVVPGGTHFVHQENPMLLHLVMETFLK